MFHGSFLGHKSEARIIHHYSDMMAVFLGFIFNITLLVIVTRNKVKGLQSFGQVVRMNCILDLYLTFTTLLGEIESDTHSGVFYFFVSSFITDYIPNHWHFFIIYLFCLGIGFSVFYAPIPFYHRYMLICNGIALSRRAVLSLLLIPLALSIWCTTWELFAIIQANDRRIELTPPINNSLWIENGKIPFFAAFPLDSVPSFIYLTNCSIFFPFSWGIPFYLFYKIYKSFQDNKASMTPKAIRLHQTLNRALIAQAVIPFTLGAFPITVVTQTLILGIDVPYLAFLASGTVSWVPAVNPMLTLLLIPAYYRPLLPTKLVKYMTTTVNSSAFDQTSAQVSSRVNHSHT